MAIPPNENRGPTVVVAICVFYGIAFILCMSRFVVRLKERNIGIDDPFLAFGMVQFPRLTSNQSTNTPVVDMYDDSAHIHNPGDQ
jgi:hypothetical protein